MTEMLILFSPIAAGGVRTVIYLFILLRLLVSKNNFCKAADRKESNNRKDFAKTAFAAFVGAVIAVIFQIAADLPDFYVIAAEVVWIAVCASRFWGTEVRFCLFLGIFYEIAVSFWEFLAAAWLGVLFRTSVFLDNSTAYGQIAVWLVHLLLAGAWLYFWKHPDMEGKEAFRLVSFALVASFIAVVTLSQQTILIIEDDTLNMWTILAVVLMMSILLFNMNRQYEVEKELAKLKSEQAALLERDYTALNQAYAVNAKLFHDFHNHIGVLRQLLSHQKTAEAIQYLDELQTPVQEITDTIWTGDETLDYLINSKAQAAQAGGIIYQVQVEFPRHTNLQSADLCAVLGNLLDNALEAVQQIPEKEERFIHLTIRRIHQMLVIKVENSCQAAPAEKDGTLKTSKEENGLHGWGLKSAQTAAQKYEGTVQTFYKDGIFRAVATLSFQGISIS